MSHGHRLLLVLLQAMYRAVFRVRLWFYNLSSYASCFRKCVDHQATSFDMRINRPVVLCYALKVNKLLMDLGFSEFRKRLAELRRIHLPPLIAAKRRANARWPTSEANTTINPNAVGVRPHFPARDSQVLLLPYSYFCGAKTNAVLPCFAMCPSDVAVLRPS